MNPDQGTELRSGRIIHSSSETSSPIDPDMAQSSANDSDNNDNSDISSQLSEIKKVMNAELMSYTRSLVN